MSHGEAESEHQAEDRRFWRRVRRFVLYPLLCILLLLGSLLGWLASRNAAAQRLVDEQVQRLDTQGLPYDSDSMSRYYAQRGSTQDLDEWLQVLTMVTSDDFRQSAKNLYPWNSEAAPPRSGQWEQKSEVDAFLVKWHDLFESAQRLAQADIQRRTPLVFDGLNTNLAWEQKVRELAWLFQLQGAAAIYNRDSAQTRDAILSLLGCARSVEGEPLIIGQLIAVAVEGLATELLQQAIEQNVLNADDLKRLKNRLDARTPWHVGWSQGIIGERALILPIFNQPDRFVGNDIGQVPVALPWRGRDKLAFLEISQRTLDLPTDDLTAFRTANRELEESFSERFRSGAWSSQFDYRLCMHLLPAYGAYGEAMLQREMRARLALLAIGARLYQAEYGKLPDTLDDLKQVGADPPSYHHRAVSRLASASWILPWPCGDFNRETWTRPQT